MFMQSEINFSGIKGSNFDALSYVYAKRDRCLYEFKKAEHVYDYTRGMLMNLISKIARMIHSCSICSLPTLVVVLCNQIF